MANPSDIQYAIIAETTPGTTPATPAFLRFPNILGDTVQLTNETIQSATIAPGRAGFGVTKAGYKAAGGLKTHFQRDASVELMLQSGMGGTWTTNVLKAGNTDSYYTLEKRFTEAGVSYYRQFKNCTTDKIAISGDATSAIDLSFDVMGTNDARSATMITGATYANSGTTRKLTGLDAGTVTIAGVTGQYAKFAITIDHTREAQFALGSANAIGIGTSGMRKVTFDVTMFRRDWSIETALLNDTPIAASITFGAVSTGYTFLFPAVVLTTAPQDVEDNSKLFVTLSFTAQYDTTLGTDVQITRL
ncbi:phage tail tube protein [Sphingomonas sp. AR_OL41]|uniref:phage tail tube protein n=1 Tax=Sphingomonas sp. AR_OL41 TaxID=3042729 RepID=UPI002480B66D|nr:phage tail tube protein [Sphingomonas sp. AR_OL41]MDH7971040.1 phage tail tube protein [Sphingomonas sp. AR_OL41]